MSAASVMIFCGSLDAGRDGVGDHSWLLREGFLASGLTVRMASLFDTNTEIIHENDLLRLPQKLPDGQRTRWIRSILEANPDAIVVFQLVPFSFDRRGILFGQAWKLRGVFAHHNVGIIAHELWPDAVYVTRGLRRVKEQLMKMSFILFLRGMRPRWVGTSITLYRRALAAAGFEAELLPLFGNVNPQQRETKNTWERLGEATARDRQMRVVVFGSIYNDWLGVETMRVLREAAWRLKRELVVVRAGRGGVLDTLRRLLPENCRVIETGFLQPAELSAVFAMCDVGLSTTPAEAAGKSGAAVAMLEHGLPVLLERAVQTLRFNVEWPTAELTGLPGQPLIAGPEAVAALCQSVRSAASRNIVWRRDAVVLALVRGLGINII